MIGFLFRTGLALWVCTGLVGCAGLGPLPDDVTQRLDSIHQRFVFADIHAHPSRFHRANIARITQEELAMYRRGRIDVVVSSVSADAPYSGGYTQPDGTVVRRQPKGVYRDIQPGEAFNFATDRLSRILRTIADGDAILASSPESVLKARQHDQIALLPALEGGDGLEGSLENLHALYKQGLRLLQLVHFRINGIGHIQTYPSPSLGLTPFGKEVVRTCNQLGIIIDLAHANTQTIMDTLAVSKHPVIFSHTGVKALYDGKRYLTDAEIQAIAAKDGVIGIWPNGSGIPFMSSMMRHIDHVKNLVGVDHIAIGSDRRGMRYYTTGFGSRGNFNAISAALLKRGYSDDDVGKIMGGNFFRVWQVVTAKKTSIAQKEKAPKMPYMPHGPTKRLSLNINKTLKTD